MLGLLGFVAIWGAGRFLRWPGRQILILAAVWFGAIIAAHLALPGLARVFGGTLQAWALFGILAALVLAYRFGLQKLRAKAQPAAAPEAAASGSWRAGELERYTRHILLREIGGPGQKRLKAAKVLVVGAGGLGSPALFYLAAAGVGRISVIDDDQVDASNLQRQIIHTDARIGLPKVFSAVEALTALNPYIEIRPYQRRLDEEVADQLFPEQDLILDGTDNFDTRYLVNRLAAKHEKPLIAAAITQWEGQISLYDPAKGTPCYQCIFPERPAPGLVPSCAEAGVASPLPGVIGSMMAMEAVKHLTGAGLGLQNRLMIHDALYAETRVIGLKPRPDCPICAATRPVSA